ncbi:MAG: hypothetical protein IPK69_05190 [Phycisphaerales bacterium]|nr:MAG: hypothetical protein IPK69_05190 [Phycisphaerales bacterium]
MMDDTRPEDAGFPEDHPTPGEDSRSPETRDISDRDDSADAGETGTNKDEAARSDADESELNPYAVVEDDRPRRVGEKRLLEDVDDDADLTRDPEVEARTREERQSQGAHPKPKNGSTKTGDESRWRRAARRVNEIDIDAVEEDAIVRPGKPGFQATLIIGVSLLAIAMVLAGVYAPPKDIDTPVNASRRLAHVLSTGYRALLNMGTGVAALGIAGIWAGRPLGRIEFAPGRMLVAVSGLLALTSLRTPFLGRFDEIAAGVAAYLLLVILLFRLKPSLACITGLFHFGLWMLMEIGYMLVRWSEMA